MQMALLASLNFGQMWEILCMQMQLAALEKSRVLFWGGAGLLCEGVLGAPPQAVRRVHGVAQEGGRAVGDAEGTPRAGHVIPMNASQLSAAWISTVLLFVCFFGLGTHLA